MLDIKKSIQTIMSEDLITVLEGAQLKHFEYKLTPRKIHHLIVENLQGELVGIISTEDIAKATSWIVEDKITTQHIMSKDLITLPHTASIKDVLLKLLENKHRAIPIIKNKKAVGIVTAYDFLYSFYLDKIA